MRAFAFHAAALLGVLLVGAAHAQAPQDPLRIDSGLISGDIEQGVRVYRGIPFAAPPVGKLRWRPPQPVAAWDGVRQCTAFGPACPQPASILGQTPDKQSEDCLYLNVWTPARAADARLPGDGVDSRRRLHHGVGRACVLPRRQPGAPGRGGRHHQLPAGAVRLLRTPAALRGVARACLRQLRLSRPDRRPAVGAAQHRGVRRRPGVRDGVRRIGRLRQHLPAAGVPAGEWVVSASHHGERRAGERPPFA